jgi:hypothetical protein
LKVFRSDELKDCIRFAADPGGQTVGNRIVLTLLDIYQIVGEAGVGRYPDKVDQARRVKRPARKMAGAAVGHWDLVPGVYWVTYNETVVIPEGVVLFLENYPALAENGVVQNSRFVLDWSEVSGALLMVGARGVKLSEGAPVSVGRMVRF